MKLSLPVRGAWIEIAAAWQRAAALSASLPVRGAWIEINQRLKRRDHHKVAPRAGSVD